MAKPSWIKLGKSSGSMNDSTTVTALEYTGRQQRGGTITAKTTGGATDTTSVSQAGKAEFINVPTTTYNAAAKGSNSDGSDTIQITGTANTANIKVAETTGKIIPGAAYKIQVNAVNDDSWDGKTDTGIDDDPGKDAQFAFTIDVKIPENKTEAARTLEIKLQNGNGDVVTDAIAIIQAKGVKSYGAVTLTVGTYQQIPAAGGTVDAPSVSFSQPWGWNGVTSGGGTITTGGTVAYATKTGWPSSLTLATATGQVSAESRTTVVGDVISGTVTITLNANGKSASKEVSVSQQANSVTYAVTDVTLAAPADIPASGGSVSSTTVTAKGSQTYTSGSVTSDVALTNGSDDCTITFSEGVSAASLGTTVTNRTKKGTLTATVTWKTTATKSASVDVYQAANTATYGDITFDSAVATRDTVTVEYPVPILTTITDTLLVAYPDIVIIHDTTFVQLLKERKEYSGKDYRAVVSGYQPSLDLIQVFPETKVVTRTISVPSRKRSHFALSLQAGYGITIQDNRITPLPYIGAGLSYSLVEW